jgi:hypothetical protein
MKDDNLIKQNDTERQKDRAYRDERLRQYDSMAPQAKKILVFTARLGWKMMKGLVKIAFRIPGLTRKFIQHQQKRQPSPDPHPDK